MQKVENARIVNIHEAFRKRAPPETYWRHKLASSSTKVPMDFETRRFPWGSATRARDGLGAAHGVSGAGCGWLLKHDR